MTKLEQIKNELAKDYAYLDWDELTEINKYRGNIIESYMNKVAIKYAIECCKETLKKGAWNAETCIDDDDKNKGAIIVDCDTITKETNIVLI